MRISERTYFLFVFLWTHLGKGVATEIQDESRRLPVVEESEIICTTQHRHLPLCRFEFEVWAGKTIPDNCLETNRSSLCLSPSNSTSDSAVLFYYANDDNSVFKDLPDHDPPLKRLLLTWNALRDVKNPCFCNNEKLRYLDLDHINLTMLRRNMFLGFRHLQRLSIKENQIGRMDEDVFHEVAGLVELDLSFNQLNTFNWKCYSSLRRLQKLFLNDNRISDWIGIEKETSGKLPNLRRLELQNNMLSSLNSGILSRLPNLEYLDISGNRISHISHDYLESFPSLKAIYFDCPLLKISHTYRNCLVDRLNVCSLKTGFATKAIAEILCPDLKSNSLLANIARKRNDRTNSIGENPVRKQSAKQNRSDWIFVIVLTMGAVGYLSALLLCLIFDQVKRVIRRVQTFTNTKNCVFNAEENARFGDVTLHGNRMDVGSTTIHSNAR